MAEDQPQSAKPETTQDPADELLLPISLSDVTLRPLTLDDVDDMMVWASDGKVARFCRWEPYQSLDALADYIRNVVLPHPCFRAICLRCRPIGEISVTENTGGDRCRGQLGYVLVSRYWGKGIVTKAVELAVALVFRERPELERAEALVDVDNVASQRVLAKAGFTREGVLRKNCVLKGRTRDMVMFSLLSTEQLQQLLHCHWVL
ncbi:uncharacterized protein LOC116189079 [Punica granatum]|uniref:Uncharacterized protein LOC116189079 n=1 Tax=Punica granatum TaxID=22663 RepID=A0A6P8BU89_PUNGR|nr:uncharacterized protein LOC116189079 [Punica granatum]XP_031374467.1 uncharacterized protein LOC116189079 [Punica granatum]